MGKKEKERLSKRTVYTIFLAKFLFSLTLIFWTVKMTLGAGVGLDDDNTFMSTYHKVDDNYNQIVAQSIEFNKLYNSKMYINGIDIGKLDYHDIYLSQRSIKKRKERKHLLKLGENQIKIVVTNKTTHKIIKDIDAKVSFTMPSSHKFDQKIELKKSGAITNVDIKEATYWNIMGSININDKVGTFFIKTNAK